MMGIIPVISTSTVTSNTNVTSVSHNITSNGQPKTVQKIIHTNSHGIVGKNVIITSETELADDDFNKILESIANNPDV